MATNSKGDNVTKSVSMPPELLQDVLERMEGLRIDNFSAYARKLIEDDLAGRGALVYEEKQPAKPAAAKSPEPHVTYFPKRRKRAS